MIERLTRKTRFGGQFYRRPVAYTVHFKADVFLRLLVTSNPRRQRTSEGRCLQRINTLYGNFGVNRKLELTYGTSPDLREERVQLEFHRLGREHMFEDPIFACQQTKQGQVGIVPDSQYVGVRPLRIR